MKPKTAHIDKDNRPNTTKNQQNIHKEDKNGNKTEQKMGNFNNIKQHNKNNSY